jgi:hypothetical protein
LGKYQTGREHYRGKNTYGLRRSFRSCVDDSLPFQFGSIDGIDDVAVAARGKADGRVEQLAGRL